MKVLSPWVHTTYACNLACPYCHVRQQDRHMPAKTFDLVCTQFEQLLAAREVDRVSLRLSGGEPLLRFKVYRKRLDLFMRRFPDKARVEILTNLTFLPPGFVSFCMRHRQQVGLAVSLDSLRFSKPDSNGRSSHAKVLRHLASLGKYARSNVGISTVITDHGSHLPELAAFVSGAEFRSWTIEFDKLRAPHRAERITRRLQHAVSILVHNKYPLGRVSVENVNVRNQNNRGCGAGSQLVTVDTDGEVYACQTLLGQKHLSMGHITNFVPRRPDCRRRHPSCEQCAILSMCGGGCRFHNKGARRRSVCRALRAYVKTCIEKLVR